MGDSAVKKIVDELGIDNSIYIAVFALIQRLSGVSQCFAIDS